MANNALVDLDGLRLLEVLDQDPRPTFVLDLDPDEPLVDKPQALQPVFSNAALRLHERLFDALLGPKAEGLAPSADGTPFDEFKRWSTSVTPPDDSKDVFTLSLRYGGYAWVGSTIQQRWRLISGSLLLDITHADGLLSKVHPGEAATGGLLVEDEAGRESTDRAAPHLSSPPQRSLSGRTAAGTTEPQKEWRIVPSLPTGDQSSSSGSATRVSTMSSASLTLASPEKACPDWTVARPKGTLTSHLKFARTVDWASTPLGPMETWTAEFRQMANLVMTNPHPAALFWGSDLTMLYNEAYVHEVAGNKHPDLMGTGFSGPFSELWDMVSATFQECARTGVSIRRDNDYLPMQRDGFLEETFFTWSFTPIYGGTDRILGFYNAPFDMSQEERYRRSMQSVNDLGYHTAQATTVKDFWGLVLKGLEKNEIDIPFAVLYSVGDADDFDEASVSSGSTMSLKTCHFEGSLGFPKDHPATPKHLDLKRSREGFVPSFRSAMRTREPLLLSTRDGTLPEALLDGVQYRGFGDPSKDAIIFPLRPTPEDNVVAFLLVGVNPRRPYDDGYKSFATMLNRQLATSLASVMLFEEEVQRNKEAAEAATLAQHKLSQQLAVESDRLRRMTELSPLGMFLITPDGELKEANDCFFEMTGLRRNSLGESDWMKCIIDGSRAVMDRGWEQLTIDHKPWSGELQFSREDKHEFDVDGKIIEYWVLFTAQPEFGPSGTLRSIMGSVTDISRLKWAQGVQDERIKESEERRRQQNEFIDITSHEMRNPLSAILQCADDIQATLQRALTPDTALTREMVDSCIDSASTISLCTQHQKAIVDDILTISKLASNLLTVNPVPTQPMSIVERALKMFEPETQAKGITMRLHKDNTFEKYQVDWMLLDPSRVLQILINLLTNAIKFTANAETREVVVEVAASAHPPKFVNSHSFEYIPAKAQDSKVNSGIDWGSGQAIYLQFNVTDTGCGLTPEEKAVLFQRFSQASPRTHAQYGGSGLGLFISRQLAEMHGGQIGVGTEAGVGSTFAFYIAARRTEAPERGGGDGDGDIERVVVNSAASSSGTVRQDVAPQRQDTAAPNAAMGLIRSLGAEANTTSPSSSAAAGEPAGAGVLHILIVEDNQINQKVLAKQLRQCGSEVSVANDGLEALAFLEGTAFRRRGQGGQGGRRLDVVLMDLEMPNMDGLTCVREVRRLQREGAVVGHVPVIAVTANVRDEQIAQAMEAGMDGVVSKPFRIPDLYKKIGDVLGDREAVL